jgi:hypothetical protein
VGDHVGAGSSSSNIEVPGHHPVPRDFQQHKALKEVTMENDNDTVGGYAVPVDPMDLLQCDSCQ